ncbi:uncharacterized protein [Narcine bancroftii]|uniref:uncharacterized protein isoform X2 n=1 Tax=Narcine bancroftii TaxID=1343680 RepID=UPI003831E00C
MLRYKQGRFTMRMCTTTLPSTLTPSPTARRSLPPLLPSYSSELLDPSPLLPVLTISSRPSLDPLIDALNPTPLDRPPHHATWLPNCRWSPGRIPGVAWERKHSVIDYIVRIVGVSGFLLSVHRMPDSISTKVHWYQAVFSTVHRIKQFKRFWCLNLCCYQSGRSFVDAERERCSSQQLKCLSEETCLLPGYHKEFFFSPFQEKHNNQSLQRF